MMFLIGFVCGAVVMCAAIGCFVSWAISGAEKSLAEDIEEKANDTL